MSEMTFTVSATIEATATLPDRELTDDEKAFLGIE